jgi:hypothetical protein
MKSLTNKSIAARYQEALEDEKLLEVSDEIAVLEARAAQLLEQIDEETITGKTWKSVQKKYFQMRDAVRNNDQKTFTNKLNELGALIRRGSTETEKWESTIEVLDRKRIFQESQRKREIEMSQMMTAEEAFALVDTVMISIRKHVQDQRAFRMINNDLVQYLSEHKGYKQITGSS